MRALGSGSAWIGATLAIHLAFVVARFPGGAAHKRLRTVAEHEAQGRMWHFRHQDEETRRLVAWLLASAPADSAIVVDGGRRGPVEALAAAVFPTILVRPSALRADGTAAGRPVFRGQPPWLPAAPANAPPGVVRCLPDALRWSRR